MNAINYFIDHSFQLIRNELLIDEYVTVTIHFTTFADLIF